MDPYCISLLVLLQIAASSNMQMLKQAFRRLPLHLLRSRALLVGIVSGSAVSFKLL